MQMRTNFHNTDIQVSTSTWRWIELEIKIGHTDDVLLEIFKQISVYRKIFFNSRVFSQSKLSYRNQNLEYQQM